MSDSQGVHLNIPVGALRPLIEEVVAAALARIQADLPSTQRRLAYSEAEAAELLGLKEHVLRDERLRGRIKASQVVGRRTRYLHSDLVQYMMQRRVQTAG